MAAKGGLAGAFGLLLLMFVCVAGFACEAQGSGPHVLEASAIAYDSAGNLYIADARANRVFEATLAGSLVVVAGTGVQGFAGDGGAAVSAQLNQPRGVAFDSAGTMYIADTGNHRVRAVTATGVISTFAGTGVAGFSGDGGQAQAAQLRRPTGLGVDAGGALLICDTGNHRVRRVSGSTIATIAGTGVQGFGGDGGPASAAEFDSPGAVVAAQDGRVFVADTRNERVRVMAATGAISTFAGNGLAGFAGDGGPAVSAELFAPQGLALAADGSLLIADAANQRVRSVSPSGVISTVAGSGTEGASADGEKAVGASLRAPRALAYAPLGWPAVGDALNGTVRAVAGSAGLYRLAALAPDRVTAVSEPGSASQTYGQGTMTASVQGMVGQAQGRVEVIADGAVLTGADLHGAAANLDVSSLSAGAHRLQAQYMGDGLNPAAVGSATTVQVAPLGVTAYANSATMTYGAGLPSFAGVLSGVLPSDAGQVTGDFAVSAGDLPPVGPYPIAALLSGAKAANYTVTMGAGSGQLTVVKAGTGVNLAVLGQAFTGVPLGLTATVQSSTRGQPTGSVQFLDGNLVIATAALRQASASAVYSSPPQGSRQLSVQYLGDANFLPSTGPAVAAMVSALPDFAVAAAGATAVTAAPGQIATYSVTVSGQPGPFTGAIALSAAGLPPGTAVSFSPPQIVPGSGSATVTVTVQTPALSARDRRGFPTPRRGGVVVLALVAGCFLSRRRPGVPGLLGLGLLCTVTGCGARTVGEGTGGVLTQTYSFTVTGTGTNLAGAVMNHSIHLSLTVQP